MRYVLNPWLRGAKIRPEIYGAFSEHLGRCVYEGLYVGEDSPIPNENGLRRDVVEALRAIKLPVLRWPGGCFADEYHWRDGIGPRAARKKMINTHWGGVVEDNSFGTHEFFEACRQIGCAPYVTGNLGSGSVREMSEWVEYMTFDGLSPLAEERARNGHKAPWKLRYFGVGNENWGCGGSMTADFYADQYRRYQTYARDYGDNRLYKIACGPGCGFRDPNFAWTQTMLEHAAPMLAGLSLHYYTVPGSSWENKGSATEFTREEYQRTLVKAAYMEDLLRGHAALMDRYDPQKRIGLVVDEWGTWYDVEPGTNPGFLYQQNTMRDAMVAAISLNAFNRHADRVSMANIAQTVNVLQSLLLTEGERMVKTPTYHAFDLYKSHQGARLVSTALENPALSTPDGELAQLSESASIDEAGLLTVTIANLSDEVSAPIEMRVDRWPNCRLAEARLLAGDPHDLNTFDEPELVEPAPFADVAILKDGELRFVLPPCSLVLLRLSEA